MTAKPNISDRTVAGSRAPSARAKTARDQDAMLDPYASGVVNDPTAQSLGGAGLGLEGMRFWTHRIGAYASYFDKLAKCRNFADVSALQTAFLMDMQRDYANELANVTAAATLTALPNFALIDTPRAWPPQPPVQSRPNGAAR